MPIGFTTPGLSEADSEATIEILEQRLAGLIDMALTLKHVHWNVTGPHFIGVHEMLDPQVDAVREMVDVLAERIATLGGTPIGTPGHIVKVRSWDDYDIGKGSVAQHLGALDSVFRGLITDHRDAQKELADLDPVSEDVIVGQTRELELFHWFVRAHLENADGTLVVDADANEQEGADQASAALDD